jgi:regulatory protein
LKNKKPSLESCIKKAYAYLNRTACSEARLRDYLERKGCQEFVGTIIEDLKAKGLIDDEATARFLAEILSRRYGPKRIEKKLLEKGFSKEAVKNALENLEVETGLSVAIELGLQKLKSIRDRDQKRIQEKLFRFLVYRGFSYEISRKALNEIFSMFDNDRGDSF